jgi:hypothetical protein
VRVRDDLELISEEGDVRLFGDRVQAVGRREVVAAGPGGRLALDDPARLRGTDLELAAERAELRPDRAAHTAEELRAGVDRATVEASTLRTTARTVISRARNVYRTVEQLSQNVAGRMRELVSGALHLTAKDTPITSERDTRIDASRSTWDRSNDGRDSPRILQGGGQCLGMPDVCKVPAPPAPPIPTPFRNMGNPFTATGQSTKVKAAAVAVLATQSEIPMSPGDEAGVAGGVVSGKNMQKVTYKKGSAKVKVEGKPIVHLTSTTGHNGSNANMPAGSQIAPSQQKVIVA